MSVTLHITAPEVDERVIVLSDGIHVIGSSLDADVLAMDAPIQARHFEVHVDDDTVTLMLLAGAQAMLDGKTLGRSKSIEIVQNTTISVDDVAFAFRMQPEVVDEKMIVAALPDLAKTGRSSTRQISTVRKTALASAFCAVAIVVAWKIDVSSWQNGNPVQLESIDTAADGTPSAGGVGKNSNVLISDLALKPIAPKTNETPAATESSPPLSQDQKLLKASQIVLSGIDRSVRAAGVREGILLVKGIRPKTRKAKNVRQSLMADVPDLKDVTFERSADTQIEAVREQIAGVWSGKRPYVVRTDGAVIKPTQELIEGAVLVSVASAHIEVTINAERHRVELQ